MTWCQTTGRDWRVGASRLGAFILWLRHVPPGSNQIRLAGAVRGNRRINAVLAAVREFLRYGVTVGSVPAEVLGMLYELGDDRDFPDEFRGEGASVKLLARPRHRLSATTSEVARATDAEAVALLEACRNARDRFLVLLLARAGLRRSETVALRRADVHFMSDSTGLGCFLAGEHLHVVRRDPAPNAAYPKSRRSRAVPADRLLAGIGQSWLRASAKRWAAEDLPKRRGAPRAVIGGYLNALTALSSSLSGRAGLRLLSAILGWGDLRDDDALRTFVREHPLVAFRPAA